MRLVEDYNGAIDLANEQEKILGTTKVTISIVKNRSDEGYEVYDLNDVVIPGPVKLRSSYDRFWGDGGTTFQSKVFPNGVTLGQLVKAADKSIEVTGDTHHRFLEAVHENEELTAVARESGFKYAVYDMAFGS